MEEDIKILEEIVELYYDCAGNEEGYDMRVDMAFMKRETQALENLIKGYRELESEIQHKNDQLFLIDTQNERYYEKHCISKTKIKEKIEEIEESMNKARPFDLSYIEYCEDRIEVLQELMEDK